MNAIRSIGRIHRATTAFLLCDIQEPYRGQIWQFPSVIATAQKMVAAHKIFNLPLIVTGHKGYGETVAEIDVSSAKIKVPKTRFSMYVPEVQRELEGIKHAVLLGVETALDLLENNIGVLVLADGVSSMNQSEIKVALDHIKAAGGFISSSESVLLQLLSDTDDEKQKPISDLVEETREAAANNKLFSLASGA
ncbi:Isochorismatase domain-containing protein 1 [Actinomortierella wolfii]|nr:Isochorismatase domain-containing protein 1 [Actinomortierella wolfii]